MLLWLFVGSGVCRMLWLIEGSVDQKLLLSSWFSPRARKKLRKLTVSIQWRISRQEARWNRSLTFANFKRKVLRSGPSPGLRAKTMTMTTMSMTKRSNGDHASFLACVSRKSRIWKHSGAGLELVGERERSLASFSLFFSRISVSFN